MAPEFSHPGASPAPKASLFAQLHQAYASSRVQPSVIKHRLWKFSQYAVAVAKCVRSAKRNKMLHINLLKGLQTLQTLQSLYTLNYEIM